MTNALRYARAAPALAMSYISIVLTIIYGYYIFDEVHSHTQHPAARLVRGAIPGLCAMTHLD